MAFGLGVLRLPPREFWAMTPRELRAAVVGALPQRGAMVPLPRCDLDALMRRYPDIGPYRQPPDR
jgi:uncharacterized phage protein (TIGR02216 family)